MEPEIVGKRIRKLMENNNIEMIELANKMDLKLEDLERKLEGKEEFYIDEMMKIKAIFQLNGDDCDELFFQEDTQLDEN